MKELLGLLGVLLFLSGAFTLALVVGYGLRLGWNAGTHTVRVCDACFRDIKRVNEVLARQKNPTHSKRKPK